MSGSEIIFIMLLALVVLGPEKLPEIMRRVGRTYGEFKRMSSSFQDEFRAQIDEPMREMRDTADLIRRNVDIGAAQVEKPKSEAAMSVDMEPDPPPDEGVDTAAEEPEAVGVIEPDDPEHHDDVDDPDGDQGGEGSGVAEEAAAQTAPAAPDAIDGFGAVPTYADHDSSIAGKQTDPEQTDPEQTR